jgi:hypothetical protein
MLERNETTPAQSPVKYGRLSTGDWDANVPTGGQMLRPAHRGEVVAAAGCPANRREPLEGRAPGNEEESAGRPSLETALYRQACGKSPLYRGRRPLFPRIPLFPQPVSRHAARSGTASPSPLAASLQLAARPARKGIQALPPAIILNKKEAAPRD